MDLRDKIKQLLIAGLPPVQVASACACSPSFVSQLLADEQFMNDVASGRIAYNANKMQQYQDIDDGYDDIEDALLKKLGNLLPFINKPNEVLAALSAVNRAERKRSSMGLNTMQQANAVENKVAITLPMHLLKNVHVAVEFDSRNQITSIDNRSMLPFQASQLQEALPALREQATQTKIKTDISFLSQDLPVPEGTLDELVTAAKLNKQAQTENNHEQ